MLISRPRLWHSYETEGQTKCHLHIIHILPTLKYKQFGNFNNKVYLYLSGLLFNLILDKLYLLFSTSGFNLLFFMRIFLLRSLGEGKALPGSSCKIISKKGLITPIWHLCIPIWDFDFREGMVRGSKQAVPPQVQPWEVVWLQLRCLLCFFPVPWESCAQVNVAGWSQHTGLRHPQLH